jgi:F-type H+-transporting ATPase subunit alpha
MTDTTPVLLPQLDAAQAALDAALAQAHAGPTAVEVGTVTSVSHGIAQVAGLPGATMEELVRFPGDQQGMVFDLNPDSVGVVLLGGTRGLSAGDEARRTNRVLDVPVGQGLLGRVLDPLGRPLDGGGPVRASKRWPVERPAPSILDRAPVSVPLATGIKVVDATVPIGRGQRELIVGDRQTGKTAIALDTILNQATTGVLAVYCAIGQRGTAVARVVAELRARDVLRSCIVVAAAGETPPGLQYVAPYAATSMAEYLAAELGRDVLIIYDDLTRHAQSYRELSLLLRRPPGREAFPGDIFYLHSRLLERSTRLCDRLGGGSLTALPIVETEAQNMSAYVPTNIISITDGQIYVSSELFQKGILPAVDVGRSVSRVGGKAQLPAFRAVAGDLRLAYSQFEELEVFARFGTRLDDDTKRTLERGKRVREVLKQPQYAPLPPEDQVSTLLALTEGLFDLLPVERMPEAERAVSQAVRRDLPEACKRIVTGQPLSDDDRKAIVAAARVAIQSLAQEAHADPGITPAAG